VNRPRVLIEDWLPIEELGIESRREAAPIPGQFPKLKTLHVWWARRPLAATAGTVLASVLPSWSPELGSEFPNEAVLADEGNYRKWVLKVCGVLGDAIGAKKAQEAAIASGTRIANPYTYRPAFRNSPTSADLALLHRLLRSTWGSIPTVLDPTAGGGSIPFEAVRFGLPAIANDLNSVAACVLRAGLETTNAWGPDLVGELRKWGTILTDRIKGRLEPYFPSGPGELVATYLFARTVACPRTGKPIPLSPNWWLNKVKGKEAAAVLLTERDGHILDVPQFEMRLGADAATAQADRGTVAGGNAISPWDDLPVESRYIKAEATAGRMGALLYAVAIQLPGRTKNRPIRTFRPPTQMDLEALARAEDELARLLPSWLSNGTIPSESVPPGNKTTEPRAMGMENWRDFFSARQLLVHGTFVDEFRRLVPEVHAALPDAEARAVLGVLAMMQSKALNYNSRMSIWHPARATMANTFNKHDFSFKWTHAEFEGARELFPWCLDQVGNAYEEIAGLMRPADAGLKGGSSLKVAVPGPVTVTRGTAGDLSSVNDQSQVLVCIDPPYSDNVMYGELSDYFGVWEQHTVGAVWPDLMPGGLADLKSEAVANVARFADTGRRKKALAEADDEAKMQAIFAECHRVLIDNGVMTVMFTHKKATAWDALGMALMEAGFTIETSWPVKTESEQSLHQAKKNAAESTIMMVCRKREATGDTTPYFEDLEGEVRRAAKDAVGRFSAAGISGVDLLLSTYGPALSVISAHWPVYSSEADESGKSRLLRPEEALDAAREEVVRMQRLALIGRQVDLDPITDFVLLAWSTFRAVSFPFDEARKMAVAVGGLDVSELEADKILTTRSGTVTLCEPGERLRRRGDDKPGVRPGAEAFTGPVIDAVHTVLYVAEQDGLADAKALIDRTGLAGDNRFTACLQGLVRAIPRAKNKGKWVRPEAGLLDGLVAAYFPDIEVPEEWTGRLDLGV
jgi:adenine-specific DNA methylase